MKILKRIFCVALAMCVSCTLCSCERGKKRYSAYSFDYFDTATNIIGYAETKEDFDDVCGEIFALLEEYHKLYDIYEPYDGVNNLYTLNNSQEPIVLDEKILDLLEYGKEIYNITNGYTNIAMGSVLSIWHDYREIGSAEPEMAEVPPMESLLGAFKHTNINDIVIDREHGTAHLSDEEMQIDVGAVAKGYAAARVAEHIEKSGVSGYIINVGGNVCVVGARGDGSPWTVGVEAPYDGGEEYIEYLSMTSGALVTSGSYQRFYYVDGKRYHHIINKDTLMPNDAYLSVSVLCDDSGLADALSTALFCMSLEDGTALIASIEKAEALWVCNDKSLIYSDGWKK